ncbi:MAG: hypothetical protein HC841_03560 [Verrucomicrobiae bacterium]|nr:hypothetical protein [Verrucomicrobiae bacterium]
MKPIAALLCGVHATLTASALEPFRIEVVERGSGWPVPLVEFRTMRLVRFVTDNAGIMPVRVNGRILTRTPAAFRRAR